jgi:hypothetical protein
MFSLVNNLDVPIKTTVVYNYTEVCDVGIGGGREGRKGRECSREDFKTLKSNMDHPIIASIISPPPSLSPSLPPSPPSATARCPPRSRDTA